MALTGKIFFTSIFTTNDFRTQTRKEREKEHKERLERVRSGSRRQAQTTAPSLDALLSSCRRDLAARSRWGDRLVEIAP